MHFWYYIYNITLHTWSKRLYFHLKYFPKVINFTPVMQSITIGQRFHYEIICVERRYIITPEYDLSNTWVANWRQRNMDKALHRKWNLRPTTESVHASNNSYLHLTVTSYFTDRNLINSRWAPHFRPLMKTDRTNRLAHLKNIYVQGFKAHNIHLLNFA